MMDKKKGERGGGGREGGREGGEEQREGGINERERGRNGKNRSEVRNEFKYETEKEGYSV